ncbi:MAG: MATE family efflux transporter [Clostridia bacterium]|nr:MATE family efflux transporter [Clostridia bacterium]
MNMTEGPVAKNIVLFAVPLFLGNLFQQLYNTADAFAVGNLLGDNALAGVSSTGSLIFLLVGFFSGLAMGAGVVISKFYGAGDIQNMRKAIHTSFVFFTVSGIIFSVIGALAAEPILRLMQTPDDVMVNALAYVRTYFAGLFTMVTYNVCMAIMQAVGDSKHPLYYLIISSILNVILDYFFMGVLKLGVFSAAMATVISQMVSVVLCLVRLFRIKADYKLRLKELKIDFGILGLIVKNGLPSGFQNSVISIANVVVQGHINHFGEAAMAGCGAFSKIEGFAFLPVTCFSAAMTTFVSQNLGAGKPDRAKKGAKFGVITAVIIAEVIGGLMILFAEPLIDAFTESEEALLYGIEKSRICCGFFFLCALCHCFAAVLRGAGKAVVPMGAMLACWCVIRVSILFIVVPITETIDIVNWVYPITWFLCSLVLAGYYFFADWTGEKKKGKLLEAAGGPEAP